MRFELRTEGQLNANTEQKSSSAELKRNHLFDEDESVKIFENYSLT